MPQIRIRRLLPAASLRNGARFLLGASSWLLSRRHHLHRFFLFGSSSRRLAEAARASAAKASALEAKAYALRQAKSASELQSIDRAAASAPAEAPDPHRRRGL